jgi:hypothetical protein
MGGSEFLRSIGRAPDETALAFFSERNVAAIQTQLRYEVYRCTGAVIGEQSPGALLSVMEAVFGDHAGSVSNCGAFQRGQLPGMFSGPNVRPGVFEEPRCSGAPAASVAKLNDNVLRRVVPDVVGGIRMHRRYVEDISQPNPLPLERPQFVSGAGRRQLPVHRI